MTTPKKKKILPETKMGDIIESLGRGGGGMRYAKSLKNQKPVKRVNKKLQKKKKIKEVSLKKKQSLENQKLNSSMARGREIKTIRNLEEDQLTPRTAGLSEQMVRAGRWPKVVPHYAGKHKNTSTTD